MLRLDTEDSDAAKGYVNLNEFITMYASKVNTVRTVFIGSQQTTCVLSLFFYAVRENRVPHQRTFTAVAPFTNMD